MYKLLRLPKIYCSPFIRCALPNSCVRLTSTDVKAPAVQPPTDLEAEKAKYIALLAKELPKPYDGPERDHVNFPRPVRRVYPGVVRYGFLPEEWFEFFYKKTGVTGPYVFGFGLITFLLSKELYIIEEELSTGIALFTIIYIAIKKFGPAVRKMRDEGIAKKIKKLEDMRQGSIKNLEGSIEHEKKQQWYCGVVPSFMQAKRENVHIQLETEFRRRRMQVYEQIKRRLDYFLELDTTRKQLEQKHMVDWIVQSVVKGITPQQEKDALQKCVADLKVLSARAV